MKSLTSMDSNVDFARITAASSWDELKEQRTEYQSHLQQLRTVMPISEWLILVNQMHDVITTRALNLCEEEMMGAGHGPPPVVYSFIVFGSAGRMESTMWSDQDNGLILSNESHEYKDQYFKLFTNLLCDQLEYLGYDKCKGKVMCSEPLWRKSLKEWEETLSNWQKDLSWEPIRNLIIASDMRHIAGDHRLAEGFKEVFYRGFKEVPELQDAILRNTVRHKATLNILGQVVTERFGEYAGGFDIKYGLYIPLVNFVRFMALQFGIRETTTKKRLEKLLSLDTDNVLFESCQKAFEISVKLRVSTPFTVSDGLLISSNYVSEKELKKKPLMQELRECLSVVKRTHRALQRQLRFAERRNT